MPGKISPNNKVSKRNISLKRISSIRHLSNISFDAESPCTKRAIRNLGYDAEDFEVKTKDDFKFKEADEEDVISLRYEHFRNRFIKMVNSVLKEAERLRLTEDVESSKSNRNNLLLLKTMKDGSKTFRPSTIQKENDTSILNSGRQSK